ncbi:MAG: purine-binding chemotaxis protein CheW [Candidatus Rokubacteria bacterium]|nr:purine-binding chemotaxis protein CheW [Candidatus Rokubacteria bacterium]
MKLTVFALDDQRYALLLSRVERVLPMLAVSPLPQAPGIALGVINLHGRVIPVVDVRRRLGLPPRHHAVHDQMLVARSLRRTLALPVSRVLGVEEVAEGAVTPPGAVLPHIGHVAGIVAVEDGILLIHDLDTFLSLDEEQQLGRALEDAAS